MYPSDSRESKKVRGLKSKYGITPSCFEALKLKYLDCPVCGESFSGKTPNIDHCHESGKVRGLLCKPCNTLLGRMGDNLRGVIRFETVTIPALKKYLREAFYRDIGLSD